MKHLFKRLNIFLIAGVLAASACNNNTSTDTVDDSVHVTDNMSMEDNRIATKPDTLSPDQAFVNYMVAANKKEIAWLTAGINDGTSKEVKDHAKMMLVDHKKIGDDVSTLITSKNLSKPMADTTDAVNLTDAKGKAWDKAWINKMVADHTELLTKLSEAETSVEEADLKTLATNAKPVVQRHLDMVKKMQAKMQ